MAINQFGNFWTEEKANIFMKYVTTYLKVLRSNGFETAYFDGFAGSGEVEHTDGSIVDSIALRVMALPDVYEFDHYWLVELDQGKLNNLIQRVKDTINYRRVRKLYYKAMDCNEALIKLSEHLSNTRRRKRMRMLALLDPFGMSLNMDSIRLFRDTMSDFWFLIPTGIGANRLLTSDGLISEPWVKKLEAFFGVPEDEIRRFFYTEVTTRTLFSEAEIFIQKQNDAIEKCSLFYKTQLLKVFGYASRAYPLINSRGSVMYHFVLASNHPLGQKIADDIVGRELSSQYGR
jgi:three-Cys-motif partner protein